jgi:hypothetical protein
MKLRYVVLAVWREGMQGQSGYYDVQLNCGHTKRIESKGLIYSLVCLNCPGVGDEAAPESSNARRDSKMNAKKLVAVREFTDKQGVKHKAGDRIEVDEDYGKELIRRGEVKEEPSAEQQPAEQK